MSTALVSGAAASDFLAIFNRLLVALRETADDSGVTQEVYFSALRDLPTRALELGAQALMREPGRRFFPTTAEWRTAAERVLVDERRLEALQARAEPWHVECADCEDTGWSYFECTGDASCGRTNKHAKHDYVRVCPCRPTNRTYQRHHAAGQ